MSFWKVRIWIVGCFFVFFSTKKFENYIFHWTSIKSAAKLTEWFFAKEFCELSLKSGVSHSVLLIGHIWPNFTATEVKTFSCNEQSRHKTGDEQPEVSYWKTITHRSGSDMCDGEAHLKTYYNIIPTCLTQVTPFFTFIFISIIFLFNFLTNYNHNL